MSSNDLKNLMDHNHLIYYFNGNNSGNNSPHKSQCLMVLQFENDPTVELFHFLYAFEYLISNLN